MQQNQDDSQQSQPHKKPTVFELHFDNWDSLSLAEKADQVGKLRDAIVAQIFGDDEEVAE